MHRYRLDELPFRSRWMRARCGDDISVKVEPASTPTPASTATHPSSTSPTHVPDDGRGEWEVDRSLPTPGLSSQEPVEVAEALHAFASGDPLACVALVESCLRGIPDDHRHTDTPGSPTAVDVIGLPSLNAMCALFHAGIRSYVALRLPRRAQGLCEAWKRYLAAHAVGIDASRTVASSSAAFVSEKVLPLGPHRARWEAVCLADVAEVHEQMCEWEAASDVLGTAVKRLKDISSSSPSLSAGSDQRGLYRLELRQVHAQLLLLLSLPDQPAPPARQSMAVPRNGQRSVFARPSDPAVSPACAPHVLDSRVASLRSSLTRLTEQIPPPQKDPEWVDVWALGQRCGVALLALEMPQNGALYAVLEAQRRGLADTLHAVQRSWRALQTSLTEMSAEEKPPIATTLRTHASPLVTHTLAEAASADVRTRRASHQEHVSRLRESARRHLEEWCELAVACFTLDIRIATRLAQGDSDTEKDKQDPTPTPLALRWRDEYAGDWVFAQLLPPPPPPPLDPQRDGTACLWSARHVESALQVAQLLVVAAHLDTKLFSWHPRRFAAESSDALVCVCCSQGAAQGVPGVADDSTRHALADGSYLMASASTLVARLEAALPHAPCLVCRTPQGRDDAGHAQDKYACYLRASLLSTQAALKVWSRQPAKALVLFEDALQLWASGILCGVSSSPASEEDHRAEDGSPKRQTHCTMEAPDIAQKRSTSSRRRVGRPSLPPQSTTTPRTTAETAAAAATRTRTGTNPTFSPAHRVPAMTCGTLSALSPGSPLWVDLHSVIRRGFALHLVRHVMSVVRCAAASQKTEVAVAVVERLEALITAHAAQPEASSDVRAEAPGLCLMLRLVHATLSCHAGDLVVAAQQCQDILCQVEQHGHALMTFTETLHRRVSLRDDTDVVCLMAELPLWTVGVVRFQALYLWAAISARMGRQRAGVTSTTTTTELARRLVCTASPSCLPLKEKALLVLGWALFDTGHVREARDCAIQVLTRHGHSTRARPSVRDAAAASSSSWPLVSAVTREAEYLHACAVRRLH